MARVRVVARLGLDNPALPPFVLFSIVLHLLAALALVALPTLRMRRPRVVDASVAVELVAAAPAPAVRAPAPAALPEKPRAQAQPPRKPDPVPENPKPEKKQPPKKKAAAAAPPSAAVPPPQAAEEPADSGAAHPVPASPGPQGPAASITALAGLDVEYAWYRTSVTNQLYTAWRRPLLERVGQPYEVTVAFDIQRDGRVSGLRVEQSSGVPTMDRSALRAVSDASPLPPLPAGWHASVMAAQFVFELYPD